MPVPTECLGTSPETTNHQLAIPLTIPASIDAPDILTAAETEPQRIRLYSGLFRSIDQIDPIHGRTGDEVLEQLTTPQFTLVCQALSRLIYNPPADLAFDKADIVQDALSNFRKTHNLQRYERTKELVVFPNPTIPQLITITRRAAINVYRIIGRRPHIDRSSDISESDCKDFLGEADFTEDLLNITAARQILEGFLGPKNIRINPLQESILAGICAGDKINAKKLALRHNTTETTVRVTRHRLLARLRKLIDVDAVQ